MSLPDTPRHVELSEGGQVVAAAEVTTPAEGTAPGWRRELVDAVMDLPEVRASRRLEATIPLGDGELLGRLRERTWDTVTRPAGSTVLVDGNIPPGSHRPG